MFVDEQGKEWFVAKDVCQILEIKNPTQAVGRLDDDERAIFNIGRQGSTNFVNEYGLLNFILSSRKPEAKEFKRWVTHEVLPSIRKTGAYVTPQAAAQMIMSDPRAMGMALIRLAEEQREGINMRQLKKKTAKILESRYHP